jgi:hypothetical protein
LREVKTGQRGQTAIIRFASKQALK